MTGYRISEFRDRAQEVERLKAQAGVISDLEDEAYSALGLPLQGLGLDVGCGPGFVTRRILERGPERRMCGVDLDIESLQEARTAFAACRADARTLPFKTGAFDFTFTRLLLRHSPEPMQVLFEMARVVRPGGVVVTEDCDDGSLLLDPVPLGFEELLAARHASLRRRGAEPHLGRRLAAMLRQVGLVSIKFQAAVVSSEQIGVEAFARIVLGPAAEAIDADLMAQPDVVRARDAIASWSRLPTAFGMTTLLLLRGVRP